MQIVQGIQPEGDGIPLFLVAPGIETVSFVRRLGRSIPVFGIRIPHADQIQKPPTLEAIAAECAAGVRRLRPHGPYALAGWCAAGVVALEIARHLEAAGEQVAFVALFDARDVFIPPLSFPRKIFVRSCLLAQRFSYFIDRVRRQGRSRVRVAVSARLQKASSAPNLVVAGLRRYRPTPWGGRVVHIWAADRPRGRFRDPQFTWKCVSPGGFRFYEVPGDHITLLKEPCADAVAAILANELSQSGGDF